MSIPQAGSIYLWRYLENVRNYSGFHLTCDSAGCSTLRAALNNEAGYPYVTVNLASDEKVLKVPNNKGGLAKAIFYKTLVIKVGQSLPGEYMRFKELEGGVCELKCSVGQADCILGGVDDIEIGKGDYSVGEIKGQDLTFWWYPNA